MADISGRYGRCFRMKREEMIFMGSGKHQKHHFRLSGLRAAELLLIVFLLIYMILIFRTGNSRDVEMSVISKAIAGGCRLDDLEAGGSGDMKRCFQINGSEYEGYLLYTSDDLMNVNELLIVKIRDVSQFNTLEDAVDKRLEDQKRNFHGYGTEELLRNAIIMERGSYFFYAVSDQAEQWEEVFLSCIR